LRLKSQQLGPEVDHSPPHDAEVKNEKSYTSAPLYAFTILHLFHINMLNEYEVLFPNNMHAID
jgi:hypothetical protein